MYWREFYWKNLLCFFIIPKMKIYLIRHILNVGGGVGIGSQITTMFFGIAQRYNASGKMFGETCYLFLVDIFHWNACHFIWVTCQKE